MYVSCSYPDLEKYGEMKTLFIFTGMCKKVAALKMKGKIIAGLLFLAILCFLMVNACCCFISYPSSPSIKKIYENKDGEFIANQMRYYKSGEYKNIEAHRFEDN